MRTIDTFTSTGAKFFAHQEVMSGLRDGRGRPIVTHLMPTDLCNHTCAFCSVLTRDGGALELPFMLRYIDTLRAFGLKAVIISGGGNPILYKKSNADINDLIGELHARGLDIGMISNGMPLKDYGGRKSWRTVRPETLDKLTWLRVSMAGFDHDDCCVSVPDIDPAKTTLGFSYILHDIYDEPGDPNHGKVSTVADLIDRENIEARVRRAVDRIPKLTDQIAGAVAQHSPAYVRLLPNCLEPSMIPDRCATLQKMADAIDPNVVFVQYKPPAAPNACYLGYIHPVLNSDGYVYPCDSCVLNESAGHKFAESWRVCHGDDVASIYESPVRSLIADPKKQCPGCVFTASNLLLETVVQGAPTPAPTGHVPHVNFV